MRKFVGDVARNIAQPYKEAYDIARGRTLKSEDEQKDFAFDQLMNVMGPGALKAIFAGIGAKTFNARMATKAIDMTSQGINPTKIWRETGMYRGHDGHWRFELPSPQWTNKGSPGDTEEGLRNFFIRHPALEEAYPGLKKTKIEFVDKLGSSYGKTRGPEGTLTFGQYNPVGGFANAAVHELQHAVQAREPFRGKGASYSTILEDPRIDTRVAPSGPQSMDPDIINVRNNILQRRAFNLYEREAGEVEARNAATRAAWTPEEKKNIPPFASEDVSPSRQFYGEDFALPNKLPRFADGGKVQKAREATMRYADGGEVDWDAYYSPEDTSAEGARIAAAKRMSQSARPEGGRMGDQDMMTRAGLSAADPLGIPSWIVGQFSPKARDAWRNEYEGTPGGMLGQMATPGSVYSMPARAIGAAPKLATAAGAAGLTFAPSEAQGQGAALGPSEQETNELAQLNRDIGIVKQTIGQQTRRWQANPGALENALKPHMLTLQQLEARKDKIAGAVAERQRRQEDVVAEQRKYENERQRAEEERARKAGAPFRDEHPELFRQLPLYGWGSALGGSSLAGLLAGAAGKKYAKPASMAAGAVTGGVESAIASVAPTVYDAETLPLGTKYQKEAGELLRDPNYWMTRVGPAAALGFGLGGIGGHYGAMLGQAGRRGFGAGPSLPAPTPAAKKLSSKMTPITLEDGRVVNKFVRSDGRISWKEGGKFIKTPEGYAQGGPVEDYIPDVSWMPSVSMNAARKQQPSTPYAGMMFSPENMDRNARTPTPFAPPRPEFPPSPSHAPPEEEVLPVQAKAEPEARKDSGPSVIGELIPPLLTGLAAYIMGRGRIGAPKLPPRKDKGIRGPNGKWISPNPFKTFAQGGGMASGGEAPWYTRMQSRNLMSFREGMLNSSVPGRTDQIHMSVPPGAYVIPADIVSGMGQGNSRAGGDILGRMFKAGPLGMPLQRISSRRPRGFATGGAPQQDVPVVLAGGEYLLGPDTVANLGGGDVDVGHKVLDKFVLKARGEIVKTMKNLPGPKKS